MHIGILPCIFGCRHLCFLFLWGKLSDPALVVFICCYIVLIIIMSYSANAHFSNPPLLSIFIGGSSVVQSRLCPYDKSGNSQKHLLHIFLSAIFITNGRQDFSHHLYTLNIHIKFGINSQQSGECRLRK